MLFVYSRVGKNRDTRRGSPAAAGAGRTAGHLTVLFSHKVLAVRKANDIYRPVTSSFFYAMFTVWSNNSILKLILAFKALNTFNIVSNLASVKLFSSFEI